MKELEDTITQILGIAFCANCGKENCNRYQDRCRAEAILAAVKASGMVEVAENQTPPEIDSDMLMNLAYDDEETAFKIYQRCFTKPIQDEAGRWTVWKRVYCEKPEGK